MNMRSTDYISKGTAVARLYKAREYLLMDKDCRKGLCFYLRSVDILDYLGVFCRYRPGMVNLFWASLCEHVWCVDVGYPLIRGAKISWYSKGRTVPLNLTFRNKK